MWNWESSEGNSNHLEIATFYKTKIKLKSRNKEQKGEDT